MSVIHVVKNVGKCWHKNLYSFKIGSFGSLKRRFQKPYKTLYKILYRSKRSFKRGGDSLSIMLFGLHTVTVHIFSCESNNVGKCWTKIYIGKNVGNCWHKNYI